MELEKLKDMLYNAAGGPAGIQMAHEAADAIEQLQAENEKLKRALAEMWFAYVNKDGEIPHTVVTRPNLVTDDNYKIICKTINAEDIHLRKMRNVHEKHK